MLGAVVFGHEQMQVAIKAINELVAEAGKPAWDWKPAAANAELDAAVAAQRRSGAVATPTASPRSRRATRAVDEIKAAASRRWPAATTPKFDRRRRRRSSSSKLE